jgi:hypothetical protein
MITADGRPLEVRYRELRSPRELRDGDQVILDELVMHVTAVLEPMETGHDSTLLCRPRRGRVGLSADARASTELNRLPAR